jgi:hypothetical protein
MNGPSPPSPVANLPHALRSGNESACLVAGFRCVDDRFQHVVQFVWLDADGFHRQTMLTSREGDAAQAWPASPPIQACQSEDQVRIMGTGMAGKSHWSLAVSRLNDSLIWDIACRLKQPAQKLGSTYDCETNPTDTPHGCQWRLPAGYVCQLSVGADAATKSNLVIDGNQIQIQPVHIATAPATVRWLYKIELHQP